MKTFSEVYYNEYPNINEGFLGDKLKSLFGGSKEKAQTGVMSGMGLFVSKLFGLKTKESEKKDPLTLAIEEINANKEKEANDRMQKLMDSQQAAMIAKLKAKAEHSKNQLDLANKNKIAIWNAKKKELEEKQEYWKTNKLSFTAEQNASIDKVIDASLDTLQGTDEYPEMQEMADLRTKILYKKDENGNAVMRSADELKNALSNTDNNDLKADIDRLKVLSKKYKKNMIEAAEDGKLSGEIMDTIANDATRRKNIGEELENAKKQQTEFDENADAVEKYHKMETEFTTAQTNNENAIEEQKKADTTISDMMRMFCGKDKDGKTYNLESSMVDDEAIKSNIIDKIPTMPDGKIDYKELSKKYPSKIVKIIKDTAKDSIFKEGTSGMDSELKDELNKKLTSDILKDGFKEIKTKAQAIKDEAENKVNDTKAILDSTPDPSKENDSNNDAKLTDEQKDIIKKVKSIPALDRRTTYNKEDARYKKMKSEIDGNVNSLNKEKETYENEQKNIATKLDTIADADKQRKKYNLNDNLKNKIKTKTEGVEPGEFFEIQDGKVVAGYYEVTGKDDNGEYETEFHPKPGPGENQEEYIKNRKLALLKTPVDFFEQKSNEDLSGDGDFQIGEPFKEKDEKTGKTVTYYNITKEDGTTETWDEDSLSELIANKNIASNNQTKCVQDKKTFLKNIDSILDNDKKFDSSKLSEKLKNMKPDERTEFMDSLKSNLELLKNNKLDDFDFSDVNINGKGFDFLKDGKFDNDLINSLSDGSMEKEFEKYSEDIDWKNNDFENDTDTELKDGEDLDAEDGEEGAEDVDDGNGGKTKKIKNPAKVWKRRKLKNGAGATKNYYKANATNDEERKESISPEEYSKRVAAYKAKLTKKKQTQNTSTETTTNEEPKQDNQSLNTIKATLNESLSDFLKRTIK